MTELPWVAHLIGGRVSVQTMGPRMKVLFCLYFDCVLLNMSPLDEVDTLCI